MMFWWIFISGVVKWILERLGGFFSPKESWLMGLGFDLSMVANQKFRIFSAVTDLSCIC
jgi:hypothetical protein